MGIILHAGQQGHKPELSSVRNTLSHCFQLLSFCQPWRLWRMGRKPIGSNPATYCVCRYWKTQASTVIRSSFRTDVFLRRLSERFWPVGARSAKSNQPSPANWQLTCKRSDRVLVIVTAGPERGGIQATTKSVSRPVSTLIIITKSITRRVLA